MPPTVDGTSMVAFSVSRVTSEASGSIFSPGLTSTSMMATSLKLPISGTRTSTMPAAAFMSVWPSDFPGDWLGRINAEFFHGFNHDFLIYLAVIGKGLQGRDGDVVAINLKMLAQRRARIGTAVAVGAQSYVPTTHPLPDLIRHRAYIVCGRNHRPCPILQQLLHIGHASLLARMQQIPTLDFERLATQLIEAGNREHIGGNAVVLLEDLGSGARLAQNRAGTQQRGARLAVTTF